MKILLPIILLLSFILNYFVYDIVSISSMLSTYAVLFAVYLLIKHKNITLNIVGCVVLFLLVFEITYFIIFDEPLSENVIDSLLETNSFELKDMFSLYRLYLVIPFVLFTLFLFLIKRTGNNKYNPKTWFVPIILLASVSFVTAKSLYNNAYISGFNRDDFDSEKGRVIKDRFPCVIGNVLYTAYSKFGNDKYLSIKDGKLKSLDKSIIKKHEATSNIIVLVIGESSLSTRYSLYGYDKNTNPNMSKIFNSQFGCVIKNAHSTSPVTRNSIPMTLTFETPENEIGYFENKSIIEIAKDNGFKTYWLGSQELKGYHSSKYGGVALQSDYVELKLNDDLKMPLLLERQLNDDEVKKFIIIHLHGSHLPYTNYDVGDKARNHHMDNYDLTILRTDSVVTSIINVLNKKNKPFTLIYTSDHGEIIGKGHGFEKGKEQYLIPFMFYSKNNEFNCSFIESFRNKDGWLSGIMNKYILSQMLGYEIDEKFINEDKNNDRVLNANNQVKKFSTIQ